MFFRSIFAPKPSLNHYMLWSNSTFFRLNHYASSELSPPRALRVQ